VGRAVLEILGDSSSVTRMFGDIVATSRRASASVQADWRGAGMAGIRASRASTQAVARSEADKTTAAERSARRREQLEKRITTVVSSEGGYRTNANKKVADEAIKEAERVQKARERSEKAATRASIHAAGVRASLDRQRRREEEQEGQRRQRGVDRRSRAVGAAGRFIGQAAGVAAGALGAATNDARGARLTYAQTERTLNRALYQASGSNAEIAQSRREIMAFALSRNMDPAELAQAAEAAQGEFSVLGSRDMTPAQRARARATFLGNVAEAQDMGQDPAEFARLAGALSSSGLESGMQRQVMRSLTGITMRGGVEMSDLIQGGLGPMQAAIARATGALSPNASAAERSRAVQEAVTQSIASMEVLAPLGITARRGGNALNAAQSQLTSTRTQSRLLAQVRNRFGANSELEQRMFERDRSGQSHLRTEYAGDIYKTGEALSNAVGGDQDALKNLIGTNVDRSGHVLAQVFEQPARDALAALAGRGEGGQTGYQRLRTIKEGAALTQGDVMQGNDLFQNQEATRVQAEENQRWMNLMNPALQRQGQNVDRFAREHPWLNYAAEHLPFGGDMIKQMIGGAATGAEAAAGELPRGPMANMPQTFANGLPVTLSDQSIARLAQVLQATPVRAEVSARDAAHAGSVAATRPPAGAHD
jgi:hypothetical protein